MADETTKRDLDRRSFLKLAGLAAGAAGAAALATDMPVQAQTTVGLWALYPFDGNANDTSGGNRHATLLGGASFAAGRLSQALNLDGTDDYVALPAGVVSTLNDFTIATWVRLDTTAAWRRIFDFGSSTTANMFLVPQSGSNTVRFAITTGGAGAEQQINSASALPTGVWKHVAVTLAGSTGILYIDGVEVGRNSAMSLRPASLGSTPNNWLGRSQYPDPYLDGQLDDFRIYSRALSSAEVYGVFNPGGVVPTVTRTPTPSGNYLELLYPESGWRLNNTFWNQRVKPMLTNWIPWCYTKLSDVNLPEGGIDNFTQQARKYAGQTYKRHVGLWFSNAYVYNVVQSMCRALMLDPQGDTAIINAQNAMRTKLNQWIPIILSAQEPDGYIHTWTTLDNRPRWTDRAGHEGYTMGYFIEMAIAHYQMTNFTDATLLNAAKRVADCWYNNIGPAPKRSWWDGHQEMEMALTRFSRLMRKLGDTTRANNYAAVAKFLLDVRTGGGEYDQSHTYPVNQSAAVGHAVRAMYMYAAMADVAMLNNSSTYFTAVNRLWDSFVNRKYYVAGGVGSGATSEGFGPDYALPNNSYCETCAGCGNVFFQHMMHLAYADGKYVDLYEEALYNNVVGTMDLAGNNFEYTNPLDQNWARGNWHTCPCCVGNFPRTILTMPSWMYSKGNNALYVNLFIGSTVKFTDVFGSTDITLTQATNYPWDGTVTLTVTPSVATAFTLYIRSPQRSVSNIYSHSPSSDGITSMTVNGVAVSTAPTKGYVAINRTWNPGDVVTFTLPLNIQRVKAISQVAANVGRVALQRGPIIYNIENVDHGNVDVGTLVLSPSAALSAQWDAGRLSGVGVTTIRGTFTNGQQMVAIPHHVRRNRGGRTIVWMRDT